MRRRDYFETFREEFEKFGAMVESVSTMEQQERRRAAALMKNFEFDILDQKPSVPGARYAHPGLLPAQQVGAPGEPAPARVEQYEVVVVDTVRFERLIEGDRDRRRRRVAVTVDVGKHLVRAEPQPLRDRIKDPDIRLMRNNQVDLLETHPRALDHLAAHVLHALDRDLEKLGPLHLDCVVTAAPRFGVERILCSAVAYCEQVPIFTRGSQQTAEYATRPRLSDHHGRAGPVAEEYRSRAIVPVDHRG